MRRRAARPVDVARRIPGGRDVRQPRATPRSARRNRRAPRPGRRSPSSGTAFPAERRVRRQEHARAGVGQPRSDRVGAEPAEDRHPDRRRASRRPSRRRPSPAPSAGRCRPSSRGPTPSAAQAAGEPVGHRGAAPRRSHARTSAVLALPHDRGSAPGCGRPSGPRIGRRGSACRRGTTSPTRRRRDVSTTCSYGVEELDVEVAHDRVPEPGDVPDRAARPARRTCRSRGPA